MFDELDTGVVIADGRCGVRLSRAGDANVLGYPTLIEVRAGPFVGAVRDDTVGDYAAFLAQLELLYDRLSGEASLRSDDGFRLLVIAVGRGGIGVSAEVIGEHVPLIRLTFEISLDQSFLAPIIRSLRREFPPPTFLRVG